MSLYPSLEDMKVDHMMKAQYQMEAQYAPRAPTFAESEPSAPALSPPGHALTTGQLYPFLGSYMGLELSEEVIANNMPEYAIVARETMTVATPAMPAGPLAGMIAPLSGESLGLQRAQVTNGIRELTLCKDKDGKIGLRVHSVNSGIFVCLVSPNSPASIAGLRFGDQILEINGTTVAGYSMDQVHKILRNAPVNGIKVVVRDRLCAMSCAQVTKPVLNAVLRPQTAEEKENCLSPRLPILQGTTILFFPGRLRSQNDIQSRPLERTVTMHKDSSGSIGFHFKNGKITALVKDSSAARNGLLTDHQILEVNGKNVVGLKDKDIAVEISRGSGVITVTVIPSYIYDHMIKKMAGSLLKTGMDHSVPNMWE